MRTVIPLLTPLLVALPFGTVRAQDKPWDLAGQVVSIENGENLPIKLARVKLTIREFLCSGQTDDQGFFIVRMPADAKPGQEVVFLHDKDGYEIFFPHRGYQRLPAPGNPPPVIEISMLPKGSKRWWSDTFIDAHADHVRSRSAERLAGEFDFDASLRELAIYTGVSKEETGEQLTGYISKFRKDATNRHRQANAEFLARKYRLAGELYLEAGEELKRAGVEHFRLGARDEEAAGDAFYNALDFSKALSAYHQAETSLQLYRANREALGLGDYPESGPDRRILALKAANANASLGIRVAGPELTKHLDTAIVAYKQLLNEMSSVTNPQDWAMTQNNLGNALGGLASRSEGPRAAELLNQAVEAYRSALKVYTREQLPQQWAMTQNNLGIALRDLAFRSEGPRAAELLDQAVEAFRSALKVHTREQLPQDRARTQNNLGTALRDLACRSEGPRAADLLDQAVEAYRFALKVRTREQLPQQWARTQNNLGNALGDLDDRSEGPRAAELLSEAVEAFRSALQVHTREQLPQDWAMTQNNLGNALGDLADRSEGPRAAELLDQAVDAYRSALKVYTREQLPQHWARTQNNLGNALQMYFQVNEFRAGLEQFGRLMREKGFADDPRLVSLVKVLRVMCQKALAEEAQATEALDALIVHVEQQAEPFRIAWSFSRLRGIVEQSKVEAIVANRKFLLGFLDAASGKSRDEVLAVLKRLRQQ